MLKPDLLPIAQNAGLITVQDNTMLKLKPRLELELMCLITVQDNTMLKL